MKCNSNEIPQSQECSQYSSSDDEQFGSDHYTSQSTQPNSQELHSVTADSNSNSISQASNADFSAARVVEHDGLSDAESVCSFETTDSELAFLNESEPKRRKVVFDHHKHFDLDFDSDNNRVWVFKT